MTYCRGFLLAKKYSIFLLQSISSHFKHIIIIWKQGIFKGSSTGKIAPVALLSVPLALLVWEKRGKGSPFKIPKMAIFF